MRSLDGEGATSGRHGPGLGDGSQNPRPPTRELENAKDELDGAATMLLPAGYAKANVAANRQEPDFQSLGSAQLVLSRSIRFYKKNYIDHQNKYTQVTKNKI